MGFLPPSLRPLINALQSEVDTHEALTTTAHGGLDASGSAAAAQAAAESYADNLWLMTIGPNAFTYLSSQTDTDFSENSGAAGFVRVAGAILWPDGDTGHLDGVEYGDDEGTLQYYTASKDEQIIVQSPLVGSVPSFEVITPDYYVDSSAAGGGDGSYASPFNSLSDLSLSDGDIVALKSGSHFYASLRIPDNVHIYRYGAGAKPIIDAGAVFGAGSWALSSGASNTYEQDVTIELHSLTSYINVTEDGVYLERVADAPTCDSTPGSFAVNTDTYNGETTITVWIHPSDSSDPTSNGKTYRYSRYKYAIVGTGGDSGSDGVVIDGVETRLQTSNNGSLRVGRNATLRHVVCRDGGKHNLFVEDGATLLDVEARNAAYNSSASMIVANEDNPSSLGLTFGECVMACDTETADTSGLISHNNSSGDFGDVVVRRCYFSNISAGIGNLSHADTTIYSRCVTSGCNRAGSIVSSLISDLTTIDRCYFDCNSQTMGLNFNTNSDKDLTVTNCIFVFTGSTVSQAIQYFDAGTFTVEDNQFLCDVSTGASRQGIRVSDSLASLISNRNVLTNFAFYYYLTAHASYVGDNNCFDPDTSTRFYSTGSGSVNLAGWQSATSQEANSTVGGCV